MAKKPKRGKLKTTYATKAQERSAKANRARAKAKAAAKPAPRREVRLATMAQYNEIERLVNLIGDEKLRAETDIELRTMTVELARVYIDGLLARARALHGHSPNR